MDPSGNSLLQYRLPFQQTCNRHHADKFLAYSLQFQWIDGRAQSRQTLLAMKDLNPIDRKESMRIGYCITRPFTAITAV